MDKEKVVVVGAGFGGLTAALNIAKERPDKEVILVEAHDKVGGLAQAWQRTPKLEGGKYDQQKVRTTYELTHAISGMHEGGTFYNYFKDLGVDWDRIGGMGAYSRFAQYITPKEKPLIWLNTLGENYINLSRNYPGKLKEINGFFKFMCDMEEERRPSSEFKKSLEERVAPSIERLPLPQLAKFPFQAALFGFTRPNFVKYRNHTFGDILDKFFKGNDSDTEKIRTTLSMLYAYIVLPPSQASGNLMSLMLLTYAFDGGPQAPLKTSFQGIPDEFARTIKEVYGGQVKLNSKVTGIEVDHGRISKVRVNRKGRHNKEYTIDTNCVVLAGDINTMVIKLLRDNLPQRYINKLERYEMSLSLMATHVITDLPLEQMRDKLDYAANIIASSNAAIELENEHNFPLEGDLSSGEFVIYVNTPTLLRPDAGLITERRKGGKPIRDLHLIDIVMRSRNYGMLKHLKSSDPQGYQNLKKNYMERMIEITDKMLIPGLSERILHREMYTGATFDDYGNPTEGSIFSIAPTIAGFVPNRPSVYLPIEGAFLAGSAILAGGVGGAIDGSRAAAREVIKYLK